MLKVFEEEMDMIKRVFQEDSFSRGGRNGLQDLWAPRRCVDSICESVDILQLYTKFCVYVCKCK